MLISKFDTDGIEQKVAEFEETYGITLPAQYKRFLLKYNGGETPETDFKCKRESSDVRAFLGLGNVPYSLEKEIHRMEWIEKGLLPIAVDSFGNYVTICITEMENGKIYFCDHEKSYKKVFLADCLKDFVASCKSKKIGKILSVEERERELTEDGILVTDGLREIWRAEIEKYGKIKQTLVRID